MANHATPKFLVISFALTLAAGFLFVQGYEFSIFISLYVLHVVMGLMLKVRIY